MSSILAKTRPTRIGKGLKEIIVRLNMEKMMHRCVFVENRHGHAVYEITRSEETSIPIAQGQGGVRKKNNTGLNNVVVLAFSNVVLLGGVRIGHTMRYTRALKIAMQLVVFTTPVRPNNLNFGI
jgi:hypothetical protein